jgi:hypothetical protein
MIVTQKLFRDLIQVIENILTNVTILIMVDRFYRQVSELNTYLLLQYPMASS